VNEITADMTLDELLQAYPMSAQVLLDAGMACIGCSVARLESLAEGALTHGIDPDELVATLKQQLTAPTQLEEAPL
jgi:hybrid cluster-associated redox disulfide protein